MAKRVKQILFSLIYFLFSNTHTEKLLSTCCSFILLILKVAALQVSAAAPICSLFTAARAARARYNTTESQREHQRGCIPQQEKEEAVDAYTIYVRGMSERKVWNKIKALVMTKEKSRSEETGLPTKRLNNES